MFENSERNPLLAEQKGKDLSLEQQNILFLVQLFRMEFEGRIENVREIFRSKKLLI